MQAFVAYLRVSTDKQGVFGLGMDAQREAVTRYVSNRGDLVAEYVEVESGKKADRPQLTLALSECRRRRATLVIAKLDRLARNVHFISGLMNSDVEFVAVDMPTANRLTIHILAAVAEHEREMISERTKAALASARARGVKLGNPRAAEALVKARAALFVLPIPAEVVLLMLDWRADGSTLRNIAQKLNRLAIPSGRGSKWHASTVSSTIDKYHESQKARMPDKPKAGKDECVLSPLPLNSSLNATNSQAIPSVSLSSAGRESKTEGVRAMYDLDEAYRMLDTFVGSGAMHFDVTFNDIDGEKCGFRPSQTARQLRSSLPQLVPGLRQRQQNIIIRPKSEKVVFIQLDDLPEDQVHRLVPAACLSIQTSPGNHQAWVAVGDLPGKAEAKEFSRRLRKGVGADPEASGATRLAGTPNFKRKYEPLFPTIRIIHLAPGRIATQQQLETLGFVAAPELVRATTFVPFRAHSAGKQWPDYERCVRGAPMNRANTGPDISRADYFWAMMAAQRGFNTEEVAAKLAEISSKADENGETYCRMTAENAAEAADRGKQRSRA